MTTKSQGSPRRASRQAASEVRYQGMAVSGAACVSGLRVWLCRRAKRPQEGGNVLLEAAPDRDVLIHGGRGGLTDPPAQAKQPTHQNKKNFSLGKNEILK